MSDDIKGITVVDIEISNNCTWDDAFQYGVQGDVSWSFNNKTFLLYIKVSRVDTVAVLQLASPGTITIVDTVNRILQLNVPSATLRGVLLTKDLKAIPTGWVVPAGSTTPGKNDAEGYATTIGRYEYDLVMTDGITGSVDMLQQGDLVFKRGVTL